MELAGVPEAWTKVDSPARWHSFAAHAQKCKDNAALGWLEVESLIIKHIPVSYVPKMPCTQRAHGHICSYMSSACHTGMIFTKEAQVVLKP